MALTADRVIVIGRGKLLAESSIDDLIDSSTHNFVRIRSPQQGELAALVTANGGTTTVGGDGSLAAFAISAQMIGDLAAANRIALHELAPQEASLEDIYMGLTHDSVQYRSGATVDATSTPKAA